MTSIRVSVIKNTESNDTNVTWLEEKSFPEVLAELKTSIINLKRLMINQVETSKRLRLEEENNEERCTVFFPSVAAEIMFI